MSVMENLMENQIIIEELPSHTISESASDSAPDQPLGMEVHSGSASDLAPDQPLEVLSDSASDSAPDQPLKVQFDQEPAESKIDTTPLNMEDAKPEDDQLNETPPEDTNPPGSERRRMTEAWSRPSIDINALKNEIITVGMQVSSYS